jgi:ribosomal protein L37E
VPERSDQASTVEDIIAKLGLRRARLQLVTGSTLRQELQFQVEAVVPGTLRCTRCQGRLTPEVGEVQCADCGHRRRVREQEVREAVEAAKRDRLVALLATGEPEGLAPRLSGPPATRQRGLVYCAYRRTTEEVAWALAARLPALRAAHYHAGMEAAERDEVLRRFTSDGPDALDVVATNAFGMGIDVRRLGFVIHLDVPGTLEAYYQAAGRAGRDSTFDAARPARCILLYHPSDLQTQRALARRQVITLFEVQDLYDALRQLASAAGERSAPASEVIATEQDLATLGATSEEQVKTLLYYLEEHARGGGQPVVERDETANRVWRLQWEHGYGERLARLPASSPSWRLVELFLHSEEFALQEDRPTPVSVGELHESLRLGYRALESELLNLARRHLVTYVTEGRVRWTKSRHEALDTLGQLGRDLAGLLTRANAEQRGRLAEGRAVYVDLGRYPVTAVPLQTFAHFLFALSREDAGPYRLFARAARAIPVARDGAALQEAEASDEQRAALESYLELLARHRADSSAALARDLRALPDNLVEMWREQPDRYGDLQEVIGEMARYTIGSFIEHVDKHVAFIEENRGNTGLILTTIDHAKSEEFDNVVVIGANHLTHRSKLRLYVSVSRARSPLPPLRCPPAARPPFCGARPRPVPHGGSGL